MSDEISFGLNQKITNLEVKLAFTEDAIEKLNQVVIEQQKIVEKLENSLLSMSHQINALLSRRAKSSEDDMPPHY